MVRTPSARSTGTALVPANSGPATNAVSELGTTTGPPKKLSWDDLTKALAGSYEGYNAAAYRLPPYNPDAFITQKGFDILEQQLDIAPCRTGLNIARASVLSKGWEIRPAIDDQAKTEYAQAAEIADQLTYSLTNIEDEAGNVQDFRHVLFELLAAIHYGFRVTEINWQVLDSGKYAGKLGFNSFDAKKCKQIGFDLDPHTLHVKNITSYTPLEGYNFSIPVKKCLRYTFQPKDGMPHGHAVGRTVYKNTWSIDYLHRIWNVALQIFGSPFILAEAGITQAAAAQAMLRQIRMGAPGVVPQGVKVQMIESQGTGAIAFESAIDHHGDQCSLAYLGSTMTTGSAPQTGTQALGAVQQGTTDFFLGYVRSDIEVLITTQLIRRWMTYNFGPDMMHLAPQFSLGQWDNEDMQGLTNMVDTFVKNKVLLPDEPVIRQRAHLPPMPPEQAKRRAAQIAAEDAGTKYAAENPGPPPVVVPTDPKAGKYGKQKTGKAGTGNDPAKVGSK